MLVSWNELLSLRSSLSVGFSYLGWSPATEVAYASLAVASSRLTLAKSPAAFGLDDSSERN